MALWEPTPTGCHAWCQEEAWNLHHPQPRSRSAEVGTSKFIPSRRLQEETELENPSPCSLLFFPTAHHCRRLQQMPGERKPRQGTAGSRAAHSPVPRM